MIAYVGGTYDIIHPGHIALFRWAKDTYGYLVVSLNTDEFVERYKGKRPILNLTERMAIIRELKPVNRVIVNFGNEDSRNSILVAKADVVIQGSDWTRERGLKQLGLTEAWLRKAGIEWVRFPHSLDIHSSDIKKRICK